VGYCICSRTTSGRSLHVCHILTYTFSIMKLIRHTATRFHGDGVSTSSKPFSRSTPLSQLQTNHHGSLPIGAVSIVVIYFFLRIPRENNPDNLSVTQRILKLDLIGASILVPAVICLLLALQWGGSTYPWNNSRIIGLFIGFGLLTIIFVYTQIRLGDRGTLPPRLFKNRNVVCALAFALFCKSVRSLAILSLLHLTLDQRD